MAYTCKIIIKRCAQKLSTTFYKIILTSKKDNKECKTHATWKALEYRCFNNCHLVYKRNYFMNHRYDFRFVYLNTKTRAVTQSVTNYVPVVAVRQSSRAQDSVMHRSLGTNILKTSFNLIIREMWVQFVLQKFIITCRQTSTQPPIDRPSDIVTPKQPITNSVCRKLVNTRHA